jgi:hypothetical protein
MTSPADDYVAKVHVVKDDTRGIGTTKSPVKIRNSTTRTINLANGADVLVNEAPSRCYFTVAVLGVVGTATNVVIGQSMSEVNAGTGAQFQPGQTFHSINTDGLFIAAIGAGVPALVSVIQVFEK